MARGKGEGSIYKRASDGMWCTSVELPRGPDGKRRRKVICRKDKGAVVRALREAQKNLQKHGDLSTNVITLEAWLTKWLDEIAPLDIRPKTLASYKGPLNNYVIPMLGKKRLDQLTPEHIRQLHQRMQNTPKDKALRDVPADQLPVGTIMLSSTYTLLAHNALSVALKDALREGLTHSNPCELVDRPKKRVTQEKALDAEQAIRMLAYCAGTELGPLWATYLLTGARRGEILGLETDRVTDVLDLSWQLQRIPDITKAPADWEYRHLRSTLYLTRPKSSAGWRIIPLVEPLRSILKLAVAGRKDGLVFTDNGEPWDPDRVTKLWKAALAEAGLPTDVVLHGARHTTADLLDAAGVDWDTIKDILGHSTRQMSRSYRTRVNMKQLEGAMRKMSELLAPTQ